MEIKKTLSFLFDLTFFQSLFVNKSLRVFILGSCLMLLANHGYGIEPSSDYQPGKIYVKLKNSEVIRIEAAANGIVAAQSLPFLQSISRNIPVKQVKQPFLTRTPNPLRKVLEIEVADHNSVEDMMAALTNLPQVEYAERVPLFTIDYVPNDTQHGNLWHLAKINAEQAWNYSKGSVDITVAIVDNAVDINHVDLSANIWRNNDEIPGNGIDDDNNGYIDDVNGWDFANDDNDPSPLNSTTEWNHGTHCAGISSAVTDNGLGISSIGFSVSVMAIRASTDASAGGVAYGPNGIIYAADNGADVISLSWSSSFPSAIVATVVDYAVSKGCILVAAAGNTASNIPRYPAAFDDVIGVANTDQNDKLNSGSSYGDHVTVGAPGTSIYSSVNYGNPPYTYLTGTSMATPLVAGLCGLMLSLNPNVPKQDIWDGLTQTAVNIDGLNPAYAGQIGAGRIDAAAAMAFIQQTLTASPLVQFSATYNQVIEGGTIYFIDESAYQPTSWQWDFGDGSPLSNLQNPTHTYSTVGTYTVTLTASNANGANSFTQSDFILVNPMNTCDTIQNFLPTDAQAIITVAGVGPISGHNGYGDQSYAEYITNYQPYSIINGAELRFGFAEAGSPSSYINVSVWNEVGNKPGSKLVTKSVLISDIATNMNNFVVMFDQAIIISGPFFIGIELIYGQNDNVVLYTTDVDVATVNTAWLQTNASFGGAWYAFDVIYVNKNFTSIIQPILANDNPVASITQSANDICEGMTIDFDGTGSQDANSYNWSFPGGNPSTSSVPSPSINYQSSGAYTATLNVLGGCTQDASSSVITVNICTEIGEAIEENSNQLSYDNSSKMLLINNYSHSADDFNLSVYNLYGQVVFGENGSMNSITQIQLPFLPQGIYLVELESGDGLVVEKIVY